MLETDENFAVPPPAPQRLRVFDLRAPQAPKGTVVDLPARMGQAGVLVDGDTLITSHCEPTTQARSVRFFLDRWDLSDPSAPRELPPINVPGALLYYDGASERAVTVDLTEVDSLELREWSECAERFAAGFRESMEGFRLPAVWASVPYGRTLPRVGMGIPSCRDGHSLARGGRPLVRDGRSLVTDDRSLVCRRTFLRGHPGFRLPREGVRSSWMGAPSMSGGHSLDAVEGSLVRDGLSVVLGGPPQPGFTWCTETRGSGGLPSSRTHCTSGRGMPPSAQSTSRPPHGLPGSGGFGGTTNHTWRVSSSVTSSP